MRPLFRFCFTLLCLWSSQAAFSQQFSQQTIDRLAMTAKVWGYLKYFHPEVDGCTKSMDTVLLGILPQIKASTTDNEFNAALRKLFAFAGSVPKGAGSPPSLTEREIKHLDLSWLTAPVLAEDLRLSLDSVRANARFREQCYYQNNNAPSQAEPYFYIDDERVYADTRLVQQDYRLLLFFRYWNIINYFYPYKYLLSTPWSKTLTDLIPVVTEDSTILSFHLAMARVQTRIDDAHGFTSSYTFYQNFGLNYLPFTLAYREGKTVVNKVFETSSGIKQGDVVLSINGQPIEELRDSLRKYASGSNPASKERNVNSFLVRSNQPSSTFVVDDGSGSRTLQVNYNLTSDQFFAQESPYDPRPWKILPGNIGYVDMGNLVEDSVEAMYTELKPTQAIIFDVRNYPQGTMYEICRRIHPQEYTFVKFTYPDATFAGSLYYDEIGYTCGPSFSDPNWYQGKVIILFNEETQSHAEFTIMSLEQHPNAVKIGSQTAGADGNVMPIMITTGMALYFTSLGVYYPDWGETQRIGIVPDIEILPTVESIRQGRDQVLERALQVASSVQDLATGAGVEAYPNPFDQTITIAALPQGFRTFELVDMLGRVVFQEPRSPATETYTLTMPADLARGTYVLRVKHETGTMQQVVIKR